MNYYENIKEKLIDIEVTCKIKDYSKNKTILDNYYEVGRLIVEAQGGEKRAKYGDGLIKEYSKKLSIDLNNKYSVSLLKYIRQYYLFIEKGHALHGQLT